MQFSHRAHVALPPLPSHLHHPPNKYHNWFHLYAAILARAIVQTMVATVLAAQRYICGVIIVVSISWPAMYV